ncbi:MAG: M15 family metallopeptidase, partial [Promicromonosporaceae bacterium]|nr:M15 family metallopeptidase [Promicromonosporaceae bacterium]
AAPAAPADLGAAGAAGAGADSERLTGYRHATANYSNGRHPMSVLAQLSWAPGHFLRPDAAAQLERLNIAFEAEFGRNLNVVSTYRTFDEQVATRARTAQGATPGTSNHGWGTAVDIFGGVETFTGIQHLWMQEHAPSFGWIHPFWAQPGGRNPQPWHWEFEGIRD